MYKPWFDWGRNSVFFSLSQQIPIPCSYVIIAWFYFVNLREIFSPIVDQSISSVSIKHWKSSNTDLDLYLRGSWLSSGLQRDRACEYVKLSLMCIVIKCSTLHKDRCPPKKGRHFFYGGSNLWGESHIVGSNPLCNFSPTLNPFNQSNNLRTLQISEK